MKWVVRCLAAALVAIVVLTACGQDPFVVDYGATADDPRPLATVVNRASDDALEVMTGAPGAAAAATVLDELGRRRAVVYFSARVGLTDCQATVIAHELSHVVADLLGVPEDPTHASDGGRVRCS